MDYYEMTEEEFNQWVDYLVINYRWGCWWINFRLNHPLVSYWLLCFLVAIQQWGMMLYR